MFSFFRSIHHRSNLGYDVSSLGALRIESFGVSSAQFTHVGCENIARI
jgi:hypothetical protein